MRRIEYSKTRLVSRHRGTLPVLLTCPHDGDQVPRGVPKRTGPTPECPDFESDRDLRTRAVTTGIAQRLLDLTGEAPSVVIAEFNREYIDANRPAECAFEQPPPPTERSNSMTSITTRSASSSMTSAPRTPGWGSSSTSTAPAGSKTPQPLCTWAR